MFIFKNEGQADKIFESILALKHPDFIVEVGSFDGESLRNLHKCSPTSTIVGFEANPYNYFNFCKNKNIHHLAVSNKNGMTTIFQPLTKNHNEDPDFNNLKSKSSGMRRLIDQKHVSYDVPSITLDTFFNYSIEQQNSFALVIDVEGCAFEVLEGSKNLLNFTSLLKVEIENISIFENQRLADDVRSLLTKDYELMGVIKSLDRDQTDAYFIRKDERELIFIYQQLFMKWAR